MPEDFSKIPQSVKRRISYFLYADNVDLIIEANKLAKEKTHELVALEKDIILGMVKIDEVDRKLREIFGLDETAAGLAANDFIGYQFMPLQDYLDDVTEKIKSLGGSPEKYMDNADKFLQPAVFFWDDVAQVWGEAGYILEEVSEGQKNNYFSIVINYLLNKINDNDLVKALVADVSHGGAGVAADKAEAVAEQTQNLLASGDLALADLRKLDAVRQQVLGKQAASIMEVGQVDLLASDPKMASGLIGQMNTFLALPEIKLLVANLISGVNGVDYDKTKNQFYETINNKNRDEFISALVQLFSSGKIRELFQGDERYVRFWRNRILKDKGLEGVRKFDENPLRREQFGAFIRHLLQERFEIPAEQAVLWGVFLSSLAHRSGDKDYERLAFGDLKDQQFKWNL